MHDDDGIDRVESWRVEPDDEGRRLDVVIAAHFEDLSRAQVQRYIHDGLVRVDAKPARASRTCRPDELIEVRVPTPRSASPEAEPIPLSIVFEDGDIIVIDKPAGMVVHPAAGHESGTLVNALLAHCSDLSGIGGVERPGIVHRLDRGTTGVMIVAKNDRAHHGLAAAFQERRVDKRYVAVVHGTPPERFVVDRAIGRDVVHRTKISSRSPQAKPALSEFHTTEALPLSALVQCRIHTGRTHQIRVHLSEAGYPIVGDRDYGAPRQSGAKPAAAGKVLSAFGRPALHAESLSLDHPTTGRRHTFDAKLPADMTELVRALRKIRDNRESETCAS